jgi:hypothetical protein
LAAALGVCAPGLAGAQCDPQYARMLGSDGTGAGQLGVSIAFSGDGNTAIAGAMADNGSIGAAFIFVASGNTGVQQGPKLVPTGGVGAGQFGRAVAISSDGNTVLIGGDADNSSVGAAYVFTRTGTTWAQGAKLVPIGGIGQGQFGRSVAMSSDAGTALIGASGDNGAVGGAYIFTRSGAAWSQQGAKLVAADGIGAAKFGHASALSADGNTAVVGAVNDNSGIGAVHIFTRTGTAWTQLGSKLVPIGGIGGGQFGRSVSISADGNTVAVGANADNGSIGAAYVFTRSGTSWSQQGPKLIPTGAIGPSQFGLAVSLSADGGTLFIGAGADNNFTGAGYVFVRSGASWAQLGAKIVPVGGVGAVQFGVSASIAAASNSMIVGASGDNASGGAAYVLGVNEGSPLDIAEQPVNRTACRLGSASFEIGPMGNGPFDYLWQVRTAPGTWQTLGNDPGPLPCGSGASAYATPINSSAVTIGIRACPGDPTAQHFQIHCVLSNACASVTSSEATYTICSADFNCSGSVEVQDIFDFLNAWFAGDSRADLNLNGIIEIQDIFDFLNAWFAGCP